MSRKVWLVRSRLAVRNARRLPSRWCSFSPAIHTDGSVRTSVRLSNDSRSGPGRSSVVPVGACILLKIIARLCRSRVGSPLTSMKCAACVTGSNTMMNSAGSCSDIEAFSPGANSMASSVISSISSSRPVSGRSTPEPQKICRKYSTIGSRCGSCAAMRRTRGTHRERDLDHLVEGRLIAAGAQRAIVRCPCAST